MVKPQPKPAVESEKLSIPLLDISEPIKPEPVKPEPIKPALLNKPIQSLPQAKNKLAGDYGEDEFKQEFKAFDNMDSFHQLLKIIQIHLTKKSWKKRLRKLQWIILKATSKILLRKG